MGFLTCYSLHPGKNIFLISVLIGFMCSIPKTIYAPALLRITSSISQVPERVINCSSSILITIISIAAAKFLKFSCFLNSIGRKKAKGVKAAKFPTILNQNIGYEILPPAKFII